MYNSYSVLFNNPFPYQALPHYNYQSPQMLQEYQSAFPNDWDYLNKREDGLGTQIGGTAGGLIGSIWGPIGNMVGKQIGQEAGGGIQEFIEEPSWDTAFKYLFARPALGGQMGMNQMGGFMRPLFSLFR
jgi:hypothetical protein